MANVTDAELAVIQKALRAVTDALQDDDSPAAQDIKKQCLEADQIVTAKMKIDSSIGVNPVKGITGVKAVGGSSVSNAIRELLALTLTKS